MTMIFCIALAVFVLGHSLRIVAPGARLAAIQKLGDQRWKGLFSLVTLAAFIVMIWAYALSKYDGAVLYTTPFWTSHITLLVMFFSFVLLVASTVPAGRIAVGVRNPQLAGTSLWAFAHLLVNGERNSVILFGVLLVWSIAVQVRTFVQKVAFRPFVSVKWDVVSLLVGGGLYVVFLLYLHEWLIGVSPMAMAGM